MTYVPPEDPIFAALVRRDGRATDRQLRLFNLACVRRVWHLIAKDAFRAAVEVAERHADGLATDAALGDAVREVKRASGRRRSIDWAVYHAVRYKPGSPRQEAAGVAANTADVVRYAVPLPARETFISSSGSLTLSSSGVAYFLGGTTDRSEPAEPPRWVAAIDAVPADLPPDFVAALAELRREEEAAQARLREQAAAERARAEAEREAAHAAAVQRAVAERAAVHAAERATQLRILDDILPDPPPPAAIEPAWRTAAVVEFARAIYRERAFGRMAELGELLEREGCGDGAVLTHCRDDGEHVRGCWVVDLVLGLG